MPLQWTHPDERNELVAESHRTKPRIVGQLEDMRRSISHHYQHRQENEFLSLEEGQRLADAYIAINALESYIRDLYGIPGYYRIPAWVVQARNDDWGGK